MRPRCRCALQPSRARPRLFPVEPSRVVAVDWSGARTGASKKIWLAEIAAGHVVRLECGRDRDQLTHALVEIVAAARAARERVVIGLDFGFGVPAWYADREGWRNGDDVWRAFTAERTDAMLTAPSFPFWGRGDVRTRPAALREDGPTPPLRETERALRGRARPFSVFQLVGAGSVGAASLRGMPTLRALADAQAIIWPFHADPGGAVTVVAEVWPRLAAPTVNKSDADARVAHVHGLASTVDGVLAHLDAVRTSDDAFDALVAAIALWRSRAALHRLPNDSSALERREGRILDVGAATAP